MYKIAPRFSWKKLASGCIILDLEKGEYFTLNDTASLIWDGFIAGRDTESIVQALVQAYEVSQACAKKDTDETVAMLVKEGVLIEG